MPSSVLLARIRVALGVLCIAMVVSLAWAGADWPGVALGILASLALTLGVKARPAAAVLSVLAVGGLVSGLESNLLVLAIILLMLFTLADSDRHLALWPGSPGSLGAELPLFLLRCQVSIVYGSAGLVKINDSWIGGGALDFYLGRAMAPIPEAWYPILPALALGVIGLELLLAVLPWFNRTRRPAIAVAVLLHLGMLPVAVSWLDAFQLGIFAGLMFVMLAAFFERGPLWWFTASAPHPSSHPQIPQTWSRRTRNVLPSHSGSSATPPSPEQT